MKGLWTRRSQYFSPVTEKYLITFCICCLNLGWGTIVVIPGPTLLDLQRQVNGTISQMNNVFLARTLGYLFSAPLGGILALCTLQMSVAMSSVIVGATTLAIPWCRDGWELATVFGVHGLALGTFDIVSTVLLIQMWKEHKASFIQLVNVIGYVGDLVAPTLARPYITSDDFILHSNVTSHPLREKSRVCRGTYGWPTWKTTYYSGCSMPEAEDRSDLTSLYSIIASYELIFALIFYLTVIYFHEMQKHDRFEQDDTLCERTKKANESRLFVICLIVLSCCMQFLFGGAVALAVGSYGSEYIVQYRKMTVDDATLASTVFAAFMVTTGLLAIPALRYWRVDIIIKLNVFFQAFGAIFFLYGAFDFTFYCIGLAIIASSLSSFTCTNICWATDRIGRPATVASVVALGYPLGEMVYPLIIGFYFEHDPNSLVYALFCNSMILLLIYTVAEVVSKANSSENPQEMTVEVRGCLDILLRKCRQLPSVFKKDNSDDLTVLMGQLDKEQHMTMSSHLVQPRSDTRSRRPFDADSD